MAVRTQTMKGENLSEALRRAPHATSLALLRSGLHGVVLAGLLTGLPSHASTPTPPVPPAATTPTGDVKESAAAPETARTRSAMVAEQIEARGIDDQRVLTAMRRIPRERFIPAEGRKMAYADHPVPIGHGQTISQPYIVALMSQLARVGPNARVLEIGTGSGYQAAILAEMGAHVWTIEIVDPLSRQATGVLRELGYGPDQIRIRSGDGYRGWPEAAPFDAILVTAAPPRIPEPLKEQLKIGGRLVLPVGRLFQELIIIERQPDGWKEHRVAAVRFVPMIGEVER